MKLFLKYLRQHRLGLAAYFVFSAIFAFSFYLYALPLAAVLYPAALCLCSFFLRLPFKPFCFSHL